MINAYNDRCTTLWWHQNLWLIWLYPMFNPSLGHQLSMTLSCNSLTHLMIYHAIMLSLLMVFPEWTFLTTAQERHLQFERLVCNAVRNDVWMHFVKSVTPAKHFSQKAPNQSPFSELAIHIRNLVQYICNCLCALTNYIICNYICIWMHKPCYNMYQIISSMSLMIVFDDRFQTKVSFFQLRMIKWYWTQCQIIMY